MRAKRERRQEGPTSLLPLRLRKELEARARQTRRSPSVIVEMALRRYLAATGTRSEAWTQAQAYAQSNAQRLGIRSAQDIQRMIDEYRQGNFARYAPAHRRAAR